MSIDCQINYLSNYWNKSSIEFHERSEDMVSIFIDNRKDIFYEISLLKLTQNIGTQNSAVHTNYQYNNSYTALKYWYDPIANLAWIGYVKVNHLSF